MISTKVQDIIAGVTQCVRGNVNEDDEVAVIASTDVHPDCYFGIMFATRMVAKDTTLALNPFKPSRNVVASETEWSGGEPVPSNIVDLMESVDVAFMLTNRGVAKARQEVLKHGKTRFVCTSRPHPDAFRGPGALYDIMGVKRVGKKLEGLMRKAKKIRMTTPSGTDISADLGEAPAFLQDGICEEDIPSTNFPSGEVMASVNMGSSEGVAVIDMTMGSLGKVLAPLKLAVKKGKVADIRGEWREVTWLKNVLKSCRVLGDENCDNIAEFGLGLNPNMPQSGRINEDKRLLGTIHIAIGANDTFPGISAGKSHSLIHIDMQMRAGAVYLDGKRVIQGREISI